MKSKIRSNVLKIGILFLAITALVLGMALPSMAAVGDPPGPAAKLAFTTQPGGAAPGALLNPQPVVTVQDANGVTVTTFSGTITLAISNNPSGGVLSSVVPVNVVNGLATFSGLSINLAGQGYTLSATNTPVLTGAISNGFNITAPAPTATPNRPAPAMRTIQGKVLSVGNNQFVIQNGNQPQITVNVDANTNYYLVNTGVVQRYINNEVAKDNKQDKKPITAQQRAQDLRQAHIPADWRSDLGWLATFDKKAQFSDIQVGDRVIARVTNDTIPLAKQVLIVKPPVIQQIKGVISAVSTNPNTITITPTNGTPVVVLNWDNNTRFILKGVITMNGQMATAEYNRITMKTQLVNVLSASPTPAQAVVLSIAPTSLSNGTVGASYSLTLAVTGGTGPYSWVISAGTLPVGLQLAAQTGIISGTPTTAGSTNVTIQVTDHNGITATRAYTFTIN